MHGSSLPRRQVLELLLPHPANTARCAEPQRPLSVIVHVRNVVAQQALSGAGMEEAIVAKTIESTVERPNPQRALGTFDQRTNLITGKPIRSGVKALRAVF